MNKALKEAWKEFEATGEIANYSRAEMLLDHATRLTEENAKLRDALKSVVDLQTKHYGDGMSTHLAMITKCEEIKQLLSELKDGSQ